MTTSTGATGGLSAAVLDLLRTVPTVPAHCEACGDPVPADEAEGAPAGCLTGHADCVMEHARDCRVCAAEVVAAGAL